MAWQHAWILSRPRVLTKACDQGFDLHPIYMFRHFFSAQQLAVLYEADGIHGAHAVGSRYLF